MPVSTPLPFFLSEDFYLVRKHGNKKQIGWEGIFLPVWYEEIENVKSTQTDGLSPTVDWLYLTYPVVYPMLSS